MKGSVEMKVFEATFNGFWHGGTAIVVAETERKARNLLKKEIAKEMANALAHSSSCDGEIYSLTEIDTSKPQAIILDNGDE
jgi:hypothetical protein